jgi:hypothetical protein
MRDADKRTDAAKDVQEIDRGKGMMEWSTSTSTATLA